MADGNLLGHHLWDRHAATPARRHHAARAQRCGANQDVDLRRCLLRVRGLDSLADCTGLLLRTWLHEDGAGQRNREIDSEKN